MKSIFVNLLVCLAASSIHAESWPQFRGPAGSAVAPDGANIPAEWSSDNNVKWKTSLPGPGSSSPIYWEDKLFVTCYVGYGTDPKEPGEPGDLGRKLLCLDRSTGKILWERSLEIENSEDDYRGYIMEHGYASSTPVTDGERLFIQCGKSGVFAFTINGEELWNKPTGTMSGDKRWGSAASPVLLDSMLVVNASDEARAIIAFDKSNGDEIWRYESAKLNLCYNTPVIHTLEGNKVEIVISAPEEIFALDPATGKKLWFAETGIPGNICPSVVSSGDMLFTTGGWPRKGALVIKGGGSGDVTKEILWKSKTYSYVPTPVIVGDNLQWVSDEGKAIVMEFASGKVLSSREVDGIAARRQMSFYASIVKAGDKLFAVSRRNGTFVFNADAEMKQIAQNHLGDESDFNATPALADDAMYLRSNKAIYCIAR